MALDLEERRQETVHALEELQILDALALEGAVGATRIRNLLAGQLVAHPVGDARGRHADEMIALAAHLHTRATDTVEIFQRLQEFRQVLGIILQVGVQREEIFAAGGLEPGEAGRALAAVVGKALHADVRVGGEFLEDLPRLVLAAIVGDDDLVENVQRLDRRTDGLDELAQVAFLVVARDDQADFRIFSVHQAVMKP